MNIAVISFTPKGDQLNKLISKEVAATSSSLREERSISLDQWVSDYFSRVDGLIFIGAAGIAVRAIAPYIKSKDSDPAVLVVDELGKNVIPILSGHLGGANDLAVRLAEILDANAVITTATDINKVWAVDNWAKEKGYAISPLSSIKLISSALLRGEKVGLYSYRKNIADELLKDESIRDNFIYCEDKDNTVIKNGIVISPFEEDVFENNLHLIPKVISLGLGSRKEANEDALINLTEAVFDEMKVFKDAVKSLSTIDIKSGEASILKLGEYLNLPIAFYSADRLNELAGDFSSSDFVKKVTGTDNVSERAALIGLKKGALIKKKTKGQGVTLAIAIDEE